MLKCFQIKTKKQTSNGKYIKYYSVKSASFLLSVSSTKHYVGILSLTVLNCFEVLLIDQHLSHFSYKIIKAVLAYLLKLICQIFEDSGTFILLGYLYIGKKILIWLGICLFVGLFYVLNVGKM